MKSPERVARIGIAIFVSILLSACLDPNRNIAPPAPNEPIPELTEPAAILAALRAGGYIIYMRHGVTNRHEVEVEAQNRSTGRFALDNCGTQRNLSPEGIEQSRVAGAAFRRLNLPLDGFKVSRYCRTLDTARAFIDRHELSEVLTSEGPLAKDAARIRAVQQLLALQPAAGRNAFLLAHQGIFWESTKLTVQEGWAVVLVPGNFTRIIARIGPADWDRMVESMQ